MELCQFKRMPFGLRNMLTFQRTTQYCIRDMNLYNNLTYLDRGRKASTLQLLWKYKFTYGTNACGCQCLAICHGTCSPTRAGGLKLAYPWSRWCSGILCQFQGIYCLRRCWVCITAPVWAETETQEVSFIQVQDRVSVKYSFQARRAPQPWEKVEVHGDHGWSSKFSRAGWYHWCFIKHYTYYFALNQRQYRVD